MSLEIAWVFSAKSHHEGGMMTRLDLDSIRKPLRRPPVRRDKLNSLRQAKNTESLDRTPPAKSRRA